MSRHAPRCSSPARVPAAAPELARDDPARSARHRSPMPPTSVCGRLLGAGRPAGRSGARRVGRGALWGGACGGGGPDGRSLTMESGDVSAPEDTDPTSRASSRGSPKRLSRPHGPVRVWARWHHNALDKAPGKVVFIYVTPRRHKSRLALEDLGPPGSPDMWLAVELDSVDPDGHRAQHRPRAACCVT